MIEERKETYEIIQNNNFGLLLTSVNPRWASIDDAVQAYLRGEFNKALLFLYRGVVTSR